MTSILIADDHPMMREALLTAIDGEADLAVVGQAANGREAVTLAAALAPDLILMDLLMPGMSGLAAIAAIQAGQPKTRILVLTSLSDEEQIVAAVQAGAVGYLTKEASRAELLQAIRAVAAGAPYLPAPLALKLMQGIRHLGAPPPQDAGQEPLTARQAEVLALLQEGRADPEIAAILHLQETTVRTHVHHILQRLGLQSRAQAVALARRFATGA